LIEGKNHENEHAGNQLERETASERTVETLHHNITRQKEGGDTQENQEDRFLVKKP
jgi:hypothetical protein